MLSARRLLVPFTLLLAGSLFAPALCRADDAPLADALTPAGLKNGGPHFQGTSLNGLTGLIIMPTASSLEEGQGRFSIVSYTLQDRDQIFQSAQLAGGGKTPVAVTASAHIKTAVLLPIATIRIGNKTEVSFGKQYENNDIAPSVGQDLGSTQSEVFGFKQVQVISRRKAMYLTLAGESRTARIVPGDSYRQKSAFVTLSQMRDDYELAASYRYTKEDINTALADTHPSKRHQLGLGIEYKFSDVMTLAGEFWTQPKSGSGEDHESALSLRYMGGSRLTLQAGMADLVGSDAEFFGSISYTTAPPSKKKPVTEEAPSTTP